MKITKTQLTKIIKEELSIVLKERIDIEHPSYGAEVQLAEAAYLALVAGRHDSENNPLSLSALFDSSTGTVIDHLREAGLDERGIKSAMQHVQKLSRGGEFQNQDGEPFRLMPARVTVGPSAGEQGLYLA